MFVFFIINKTIVIVHDACESSLGKAGALYIPTVQAALPRLLGAAAPPGTGARENRHQCRKVLLLFVRFEDSLMFLLFRVSDILLLLGLEVVA